MFHNRSANTHNFAMTPRADIPRSRFRREWSHKTTFDAGKLIPIHVDEILPGDTVKQDMTALCRMVTPIFPLMDNLYLDTFWFYVPNRLVWNNWVKMMGEQDNPGDSISYTTPQVVSPANGFPVGSLFDYFGCGTVGQITAGNTQSVSALYSRAYNLIWNTWFRDENLQNSVTVDKGDGPDTYSNYVLKNRGKRFDYFTGCLPWPQKGATAVSIPLTGNAPVIGNGKAVGLTTNGSNTYGLTVNTGTALQPFASAYGQPVQSGGATLTTGAAASSFVGITTSAANSGMVADLSAVAATTINQLRLAFQTQKLLERDARGGTRYTEIVRSHFGVISPDARLQRPEYLGGSSRRINITPIAQTSGTSASGTTTPMATLAGVATCVSSSNHFMQSFTEHGMIIGLASVRADLTYQQGLPRKFSRTTRYSYYMPVFCMIGEQAVLNKEIYCIGSATGGITAGDQDMNTFGYQEAWAEYRYFPSMITGLFRSTSAGTLDPWHVAQKFTALPALNDSFITDTPPISRIVAVGAAANGAQFYFDSLFEQDITRQMPMTSVPGLIDHF